MGAHGRAAGARADARGATVEAVSSQCFHHSLFDRAQLAVYHTMKHDTYRRFVSSPEYTAFLAMLRAPLRDLHPAAEDGCVT